MADRTKIEWTDATINPIRARRRMPDGTIRLGWHCEHVSEACRHCYAEAINRDRFGTGLDYKPRHIAAKGGEVEIVLVMAPLFEMLRWRRPRRVFVCSMTDLFADFVPDRKIDHVFAAAALAPRHTLQVLTKRPDRMRRYMSDPDTIRRVYDIASDIALSEQLDVTLIADPPRESFAPPAPRCRGRWPLPNVWLGVTAERQTEADARIPVLLDTPAAKRFVSVEPMLGAVDLRRWASLSYECGASCGLRLPGPPKIERCVECGEDCGPETEPIVSEGCPRCGGELEFVCPDCGHYMVFQHPDTRYLDWVICGGESGPGARPMHPDWARSLRDQCKDAGVPFFFKQWGEWAPGERCPFPTRTEQTALWFNDQWAFDTLTVKQSEKMHRDDEPDLYRCGKARAGDLLDGAQHHEFPETSHG